MNLVLFGPPGAGKGTQSADLVKDKSLNLTHVSTGDLLRTAMKNQTVLGIEAKKYVDGGNLVPDNLMIMLIQEVLKQTDTGLLLDGFPRTTAQAEALDALLEKEGTKLQKAVFLEVPRDLLRERLVGRRICSKCGHAFHIKFHPSPKGNLCSLCGAPLIHRPDDQADVIEHRLEVYDKNTAPLKDFYRKSKRFISVDGSDLPGNVFARIKKALES